MPTDEDKTPEEVKEPEKVEETPEEVKEPEVTEPEKVDEPETKEETPEETKQPEEVKEPETVVEETTEPEVDVDELLSQITDKDGKIETLTSEYKKEQAKTTKLKEQVKSLEAVVSGLVDGKLKEVPEEYHSLIPDGDSVSKLNWLSKAEESGLFKKKETAPQVEIGKPLELGNPNEKSASKVTGQQKLANYFSNHFKK